MLKDLIIPKLQSQGVIGSQGNMTFNLMGISEGVSTKDVIGGLLQDWFGRGRLRKRKIKHAKP